MYVLHTCDNEKCRNIEHLYLGTQSDNNKDRVSRGRSQGKQKGGWFGNDKLTNEQAELIKNSSKSKWELAHEFNISWTTVHRIKLGVTRLTR